MSFELEIRPMTQSADAKICFQQAAVLRRYQGKWLPNTAWAKAINTSCNKSFNNTVVSRGITSFVPEEGNAPFTQDGQECIVYHHRAHVITQAGNKNKSRVHFYYVQSADKLLPPEYPKINSFWQECFDRHATVRDSPKTQTRQKRQQQEGATDKKENKRPKLSSKKSQAKHELALTQEQVEASLKGVSKKIAAESTSDAVAKDSSPPPAMTKEESMRMLREAWHQSYPSLRFPENLLVTSQPESQSGIAGDTSAVVSDTSDVEMEETDDTPKGPIMSGRYHVHNHECANGFTVKDVPNNYHVVSDTEYQRLKFADAVFKAMDAFFKPRNASGMTSHLKRLLPNRISGDSDLHCASDDDA